MIKWGFAVALACLGCGDDNAATPDSAVAADAAPDAPLPDASPYCQAPANDANQGHIVIFLNYEGVQLHPCSGAGCPDPTMDKTPLISGDGGVVPPFDSTIASRQQYLDQVTQAVQQAMAPYDVQIVTTRPASGPYAMIAFGGTCTAVSGMSCPNVAAIGPGGICTMPWSPQVALVFDTSGIPAVFASNLALFNIGTMVGLSCSTQQGNCINCQGGSGNGQCMFTGNSTVDTQFACTGVGTTEDQLLMLKQKLGCR